MRMVASYHVKHVRAYQQMDGNQETTSASRRHNFTALDKAADSPVFSDELAAGTSVRPLNCFDSVT